MEYQRRRDDKRWCSIIRRVEINLIVVQSINFEQILFQSLVMVETHYATRLRMNKYKPIIIVYSDSLVELIYSG